jgi:ribokinase
MDPVDVVVLGQVARDLVVRVPDIPASGGSVAVTHCRELLGGKGANQAVGIRQLGGAVAVLGLVGEDPVGAEMLRQARSDGIDVSGVVRRGRTALLIDVVTEHGERRLLEAQPAESLTVADVTASAALLESARFACLQLQQPAEAVLAAARIAAGANTRIVLDGAAPADVRDELLALADVVRADAREAQLLVGHPVKEVPDAERAVDALLSAGPALVALTVPGVGDLVGWPGGSELFEHAPGPVVDPTGGGDAFIAGLVTALLHDCDPRRAGAAGAHCAARTVQTLGGRPTLDPDPRRPDVLSD